MAFTLPSVPVYLARMPNRILTVGHSTRGIEEFIDLLQGAGVTMLVDVRRYPGSKRYPHFGSDALAQRLAESGIQYVHEVALGGRRRPAPDSPNTHWRNEQFRGYADHMSSPEFQAALGRLTDRAESELQAIMCSEAVPWRCHRQLIGDALVARGYEVLDLYNGGRTETHRLNPAAHVQPDHTLTYT